MNSQSNPDQDWSPVDPGQLQSLSNRLRRPSAASLARLAALSAAAGAVLVLAVGVALSHFGDHPTRLACSEVGPNLAAYAAGECPEPLAEQIEWHLRSCARCRAHLEELRRQQAATPPRSLLATRDAAQPWE